MSFVVLASGLLAPASRSLAAEDAEAIVKKGVELRRQGKDREALEEFRRAWEIEKAPRTEAQLALAEQALGLWVSAEEHLREALQRKQDLWIKKNTATLEKALVVIGAHLGTLEIWGAPAGATIFVNEKNVGTLPLGAPLRIAGDSAVLRARADGYLELTRTVRVPPGDSVREHVELVPATATAAKDRVENRTEARPPTETTPPAITASNTNDAPRTVDETPRRSRLGLRPFAWATAAAAAAGLTLGVVETVVAVQRRSDFMNHMGPNPDDPLGAPINDCNTDFLTDACRPLQQKFNRAMTLAIVGYAAGIVFAAGSTALFVLSRPEDRDGSQSALSCGPAAAGRGVSCVVSF